MSVPDRSVLVTGAQGYLGTVLMNELDRRGIRTTGVDNSMTSDVRVPLRHGRYVDADVRHIADWKMLLTEVDAVIHLAAIVGDPACGLDPDLAWETNYHATARLTEACRRYGVRDLIFASTCSNYGVSFGRAAGLHTPLHPQSVYAQSKAYAELHLLSNADTDFSPRILRLSTLYGRSPRMRFDLSVNAMTAQATTMGEIQVHGGEQWRPFLHVADAARSFIQMLDHKSNLSVWNCGSSAQNYRIAQIAEIIVREVPGTRIVRQEQTTDERDYLVDFQPIREELGFWPHHTVETEVRALAEEVRREKFGDCGQARYSNHDTLRAALADRTTAASSHGVPQLIAVKG
jgi:nucleoside-diphosphate-sugar epimerase